MRGPTAPSSGRIVTKVRRIATTLSPGLAIGPDGMVAVTGSSNGNFWGESLSDYATVVYREALSAVAIEPVPSGVRLSFTGIAGQSYTIQRAPAVIGPWSTLDTPAAPSTASSNTSTPNLPQAPPSIGRASHESRRSIFQIRGPPTKQMITLILSLRRAATTLTHLLPGDARLRARFWLSPPGWSGLVCCKPL
jgi:hypothetical protein